MSKITQIKWQNRDSNLGSLILEPVPSVMLSVPSQFSNQTNSISTVFSSGAAPSSPSLPVTSLALLINCN